jgi:hypothetical protein
MNVQKNIKELIQFYVQMNYEKHLKDNNIECIQEEEIYFVVDKFYDGEKRKAHIKQFVLNGIKTLASKSKDECNYNNITLMLNEILDDDQLVKTRVIEEITIYQRQKSK